MEGEEELGRTERHIEERKEELGKDKEDMWEQVKYLHKALVEFKEKGNEQIA